MIEMTDTDCVESQMVTACISLSDAYKSLERAECMPLDGTKKFARDVAIYDAMRDIADAQRWIMELVQEWHDSLVQKP
jgi:hypothetical protein